ncbi:MAG: pitrilysin family protein [Rhodobacteraceae bacterium]|nr:pitrilysin family protein [Paracoccaceae bacterium]
MKRLTAAAVALSLMNGTADAAQKVTEFRLENGLQVVVIEDHRAPAVSQLLWYRTGGSDGPPGKSGIAHFVEHLMFKGTEKFPPGVFRDVVQELGGSDNAFTGRDFTAYVQRIAADRLGTIMEMEADRMHGIIISDEDIETERRVVLEERNQRTDTNPGSLFREQSSASLYLNHPYGVPVIGWKHEIEALNRDDIFGFYRRHYAPNNAILVLAGDVTVDEARVLAERYYGPLPANPEIEARQRPQEPPHLAGRRLVFEDERISLRQVFRTYLAPERNPGDQRQAAALEMLETVLSGDGLSSFLKQKLEVEEQIAIHSDAFYSGATLDRSEFGLIVLPAEDVSLEEAEAALDRTLAAFLESEIEEEQLRRIRKAARAGWIYEQDSVHGLAFRYGRELMAGLTLQDIAEWPELIQSVSAEEILQAAREVFLPERSVTGWLRSPEGES